MSVNDTNPQDPVWGSASYGKENANGKERAQFSFDKRRASTEVLEFNLTEQTASGTTATHVQLKGADLTVEITGGRPVQATITDPNMLKAVQQAFESAIQSRDPEDAKRPKQSALDALTDLNIELKKAVLDDGLINDQESAKIFTKVKAVGQSL